MSMLSMKATQLNDTKSLQKNPQVARSDNVFNRQREITKRNQR
jgi:hypothetical protein